MTAGTRCVTATDATTTSTSTIHPAQCTMVRRFRSANAIVVIAAGCHLAVNRFNEKVALKMSDYIHIQHPDPFGPNGVEGYHYRNELQIGKLELEMKALRRHHDEIAKYLESIFNRIEAGKSVKLRYPDGKTIMIGAVENGDMT